MFPEAKALLPQHQPSARILSAWQQAGVDAIRVTAFHEACHTVSHVLKGSELLWVDIMPKGRAVGTTMPNNKTMTAEQQTVTALAGVYAGFLSETKETFFQSTRDDTAHAMFGVVRMCGAHAASVLEITAKPEDIERTLGDQWTATRELLGKPQRFHLVRVVANALLMQGHMSGPAVHAIVSANASEPSASIVRMLANLVPAVHALGAEILPDKGKIFLAPCGTRLSPTFFEQSTA